MAGTNTATANCAKLTTSKAGPSSYQNGSTHSAIINKIKDIYSTQTLPTLAAWLKLSLKTAKNRLEGSREFKLEEVEQLLQSDHGFEILRALMSRAKRKPHWWAVCEPLMDFASIEQMQVIVQKRVAQAIKDAADANEAVTQELRRAQTMAIHDPEFHQPRLEALRSYAGADRRVVAPKARSTRA